MKWLITIFISLISLNIFSQQANDFHKITGIVQDADTHTPLQFVTITLQNTENKEVIGDVTNKDGTFELNVSDGKYHVIIGSLSFKSFKINTLTINQDIELGTIELSQKTEELDEVEIITKTKLLNYKSGKKTYNASKDIANIGGNAITVLENTPTVKVDGQGNIYIRGNKAQVLVNGKPYGGIKGNADLLSLIPASSINKVEILNQSAKYDAKGGGGILNIILKKSIKDGYNGTIEVRAGIPDNEGISTFLSYKTDKINLFSTASINHSVINKKTNIKQIFLDDNQNPIGNFEQNREDYRQRNSVLFNIGSDFYLDKKNTLTTSLLYSNTNKNYDSELFLDDYQPVDNLIKTSIRDVDNDSDESYLEAFINYTLKLNGDGHKLSANINYEKNNSKNNTLISDQETYPNNDISNQKYLKDEYVDNYFFQVDYNLPLKNQAKIEAGVRFNFRNYKNDFITSWFNEGTQQYEAILAFTNIINYDENINALYATYSKEYKNFNYSLGLRTEITQTKISDNKTQEHFKNNYTDFLPTVSINYNFKKGSSLSAFYGRSVGRPSIPQLNPFNSFTDERFIIIGNPFLNPSYSNYFALEHYKEYDKLTILSALFHTNTTDHILDVLEKTEFQTDDGFDIYKLLPVNNGTINQTGFELLLTYFPTNKLRLGASITPFYASLSNTRDNQYDYDDFRWYTQLSANYRFSNTLRLKIDYSYQSPTKTGATKFEKYQFANITASKDILNSKATISLRVQDVFNGRKGIYNSLEANTISKRVTTFETRYLLSFSYRFNKASKRNTHNRSKDIDKNIFEIKEKTK